MSITEKDMAAWVEETFGAQSQRNKRERAVRFLEEALELAQASGVGAHMVQHIIHRVFSKPADNPVLELRQCVSTLMALAHEYDVTLQECADVEFKRMTALPREKFHASFLKKIDARITYMDAESLPK